MIEKYGVTVYLIGLAVGGFITIFNERIGAGISAINLILLFVWSAKYAE